MNKKPAYRGQIYFNPLNMCYETKSKLTNLKFVTHAMGKGANEEKWCITWCYILSHIDPYNKVHSSQI